MIFLTDSETNTKKHGELSDAAIAAIVIGVIVVIVILVLGIYKAVQLKKDRPSSSVAYSMFSRSEI